MVRPDHMCPDVWPSRCGMDLQDSSCYPNGTGPTLRLCTGLSQVLDEDTGDW